MTGWRSLPGGTGTVLALSGGLTLAAQLGALTVWSNGERVTRVNADLPNPARPRIVERRVYWGPHVAEVDLGTHRRLVPTGVALPGYALTAHAWAPGGDAAVAAGRWTGPPGPSPALVALLDGEGGRRAVLWEAPDLAPVALWHGDARIVVGTRSPQVFDGDGRLLRTLPGTTSPFRMEADTTGTRLLVAEHSRLAVWLLATGELLGHRAGTWVDAALTPNGARVITADFSGRLQVHQVAPDLPIVGELATDDPATAVAATDDRVVAAFAQLPGIRTAALS